MSIIESHKLYHERLFKEILPFQLRALERVEAEKGSEGQITYHIHLADSEDFPAQIVKGEVIGNGKLNLYRIGRNPGAEFFSDQYQKIQGLKTGEQVNLASKDHPIRWSSAGGLVVLQDAKGMEYVPLNMRSSRGYYPNRMGDFAGMSNKVMEWLFPECLGKREMLEELIISEGGKLIFPSTTGLSDSDRDQIINHQREIVRRIQGSDPADIDTAHYIDVTPRRAVDNIAVHFKGQVLNTPMIVRPDFSTASLEMRRIFRIGVENVDDLVLFDGETEIFEPGIPKNRVTYLFPKPDLIDFVKGESPVLIPYAVFHDGRKSDITGQFSRTENVFTPVVEGNIPFLEEI